MRIISGKYRGKKLVFPDGEKTRPTKDRIRESIFNILNHASWAEDCVRKAYVLDGFAGTGSFGLEALSRGAAHSLFIENDKDALKACKTNISATNCDDISKVLPKNIFNIGVKPNSIKQSTLVFLDPPYDKALGEKALKYLLDNDWLSEDAIIVLEESKNADIAIPDNFKMVEQRSYGIATVYFLVYEGIL